MQLGAYFLAPIMGANEPNVHNLHTLGNSVKLWHGYKNCFIDKEKNSFIYMHVSQLDQGEIHASMLLKQNM